MSVVANSEDYGNRGPVSDNEYNVVTENVRINENSVISFSYDGGRVSVMVDGVDVYSSMAHSHDVSVEIKNE